MGRIVSLTMNFIVLVSLLLSSLALTQGFGVFGEEESRLSHSEQEYFEDCLFKRLSGSDLDDGCTKILDDCKRNKFPFGCCPDFKCCNERFGKLRDLPNCKDYANDHLISHLRG